PEPAPTNLPASLTSLVGRKAEIAQVQALLRSPARLVTLVGPGGIGKTRLALEAAGGLGDAFQDGVCFVPLAAISDPALVPSALAQTLGVQETPGRSLLEAVHDYLRPRQQLLVLDNFEQIL